MTCVIDSCLTWRCSTSWASKMLHKRHHASRDFSSGKAEGSRYRCACEKNLLKAIFSISTAFFWVASRPTSREIESTSGHLASDCPLKRYGVSEGRPASKPQKSRTSPHHSLECISVHAISQSPILRYAKRGQWPLGACSRPRPIMPTNFRPHKCLPSCVFQGSTPASHPHDHGPDTRL